MDKMFPVINLITRFTCWPAGMSVKYLTPELFVKDERNVILHLLFSFLITITQELSNILV